MLRGETQLPSILCIAREWSDRKTPREKNLHKFYVWIYTKQCFWINNNDGLLVFSLDSLLLLLLVQHRSVYRVTNLNFFWQLSVIVFGGDCRLVYFARPLSTVPCHIRYLKAFQYKSNSKLWIFFLKKNKRGL